MVTRGYGKGKWKLLFKRYRISVLLDEKVIEMDGDNDRTTTSIYLMILNINLK